MGCLNDRSRIATFFEKLAHFFRFVRKIRVITAQNFAWSCLFSVIYNLLIECLEGGVLLQSEEGQNV